MKVVCGNIEPLRFMSDDAEQCLEGSFQQHENKEATLCLCLRITWLMFLRLMACMCGSLFHNLEEGYSVLPIPLVNVSFVFPIRLYPWKNVMKQ